MKNEYTSILFAIYANGNKVKLNWLTRYVENEFINTDKIIQYIMELIDAQLIIEENGWLSLTEIGKETTLITAEIISDTLIRNLQHEMI